MSTETETTSRSRRRVSALAAVMIAATGGLLLNASLNSGSGSTAKAELAVPVPGTVSTEGEADDPRGPVPFGTKVWKNSAGQTCAVLGHRVDGRLVGPDGTGDFQPAQGDGGCVDLDEMSGDLDVRRDGEFFYGTEKTVSHATVIWGLAKPGIRTVEARTDTGTARAATVTKRGVFLLVFPGAVTGRVDVVGTTGTGAEKAASLQAMPAEIRDRVLHPRTAEEARREIAEQDGGVPTGASAHQHP